MRPRDIAERKARPVLSDFSRQGRAGPSVSVIVPHKDDESSLRVLLESLAHQTFPLEEFEVIVVNNGQAPLEIEGPPGLNLRHECEPEGASYAARNRGIEVSEGIFLAFVDADCVAHPKWLWEGVEALIASPGAIIGGEIQLFCSSAKPSLAEQHQLVFAFDQSVNIEFCRGLPTANLFVRRETFNRVGEFEPQSISGGDAEWSRRCLHFGVGWQLAPRALVYHPARSTVAQLVELRRRYATATDMFPGFLEKSGWVLRWASPRQGALSRLRKRRTALVHAPLRVLGLHFFLAIIQIGLGLSSAFRTRKTLSSVESPKRSSVALRAA